MSVITLLDLGANPNDGQGDPLRTGGQEINTNFTNLNVDKLESGGYTGTGQQLKDEIDAIQAGNVTLAGNNAMTGSNSFATLTTFLSGIDVTGASVFSSDVLFENGIRMNSGTLNISGPTQVQTNLGKFGITGVIVINGTTLNFEKGILVN